MKIDIVFRPPLRRWHVWLADALAARGHGARFVPRVGRNEVPLAARMMLAAERRLVGPRSHAFDSVAHPPARAEGPADVTIVLDGGHHEAGRALMPLFDGAAGAAAVLSIAMCDGAPSVCVRETLDGRAPRAVVTAVVAIEDRHGLSRPLDRLLRRLVTLLVQAAETDGPGAPHVGRPMSSGAVGQGVTRAVMRNLVRKLARRRARRPQDRWRIGYRHTGLRGDEPFTLIEHDENARFLADPMPFTHDGRTCIFFEDFPYATRRGVIGVVEIEGDGALSAPRTVLEEGFHLSYPFVFAYGDHVYMLPETSAARRIQLYRAGPFPDRWVSHKVLVDDIVASDATVIEHDGRWWMFATLADDGGSTWDALGLFHADDPLGPWHAHPRNPVLVDAGAARPAGAMWHEDGALMRVAQDCRAGYGRGLAICRVDRLDPAGYAQTVVRRIAPPPGSGADGIHTLNRTERLEIVDLHFP